MLDTKEKIAQLSILMLLDPAALPHLAHLLPLLLPVNLLAVLAANPAAQAAGAIPGLTVTAA